jgi:hypothetical protein
MVTRFVRLWPCKEARVLVTAQYKGHSVTALRVGRRNARRFFAKSTSAIEFELDHLRIECGLPPEFWDGEAEIRDLRLCAWLESKHHPRRPPHTDVTLAMIPAGRNSYKLSPVLQRAAN